MRRLRASISVLGPLVARCGEAKVSLPGGDNIGSRGLDMHIRGLQDLGATCASSTASSWRRCTERLRGATLWLDFPSVGATENLLMAAVLAEGTTVIDNVAREPEIVDLCEMLLAMGAEIEGVGDLDPGRARRRAAAAGRATRPSRTGSSPAPGRSPSAIAGGDLTVEGGRAHHLDIVLDKLASAGARRRRRATAASGSWSTGGSTRSTS